MNCHGSGSASGCPVFAKELEPEDVTYVLGVRYALPEDKEAEAWGRRAVVWR